MNAQPDLFGSLAQRAFVERHAEDHSIQARFEKFHADNPEIFNLFRLYVGRYAKAGRRRVSAKLLIERIRDEVDLRNVKGDTYKINNSYTSRYVRLYLEQHPEHAEMFEVRDLRVN